MSDVHNMMQQVVTPGMGNPNRSQEYGKMMGMEVPASGPSGFHGARIYVHLTCKVWK